MAELQLGKKDSPYKFPKKFPSHEEQEHAVSYQEHAVKSAVFGSNGEAAGSASEI